jgi:hypothetical protein
MKVMKIRVLKNNGNAQYSFHADFKDLTDAINYVNWLTDCRVPVIDKTDYRTRYDFYDYMILVIN